jgi:hypothetical protein
MLGSAAVLEPEACSYSVICKPLFVFLKIYANRTAHPIYLNVAGVIRRRGMETTPGRA